MAESRPSRRLVLTAGAATSALLVAGPTGLAGCSSWTAPAPEKPDPLTLPAQRAESDTALARAVAAAHAELAAAAGALAMDRQAHTVALRAELRRVRPHLSSSSPSPSDVVPPPAPSTATADPDSAREALARAVHAAQEEAAGLVATLPAYRAALLASVAACCATHAAVLL